MSFLGSISLLSNKTLGVVFALTVVSLLAGALLLPRFVPARCPSAAGKIKFPAPKNKANNISPMAISDRPVSFF